MNKKDLKRFNDLLLAERKSIIQKANKTLNEEAGHALEPVYARAGSFRDRFYGEFGEAQLKRDVEGALQIIRKILFSDTRRQWFSSPKVLRDTWRQTLLFLVPVFR